MFDEEVNLNKVVMNSSISEKYSYDEIYQFMKLNMGYIHRLYFKNSWWGKFIASKNHGKVVGTVKRHGRVYIDSKGWT